MNNVFTKAVKGAVIEVNTRNSHFGEVDVVVIPRRGEFAKFTLYHSCKFNDIALYKKGDMNMVWALHRKGLIPEPTGAYALDWARWARK